MAIATTIDEEWTRTKECSHSPESEGMTTEGILGPMQAVPVPTPGDTIDP